MITSSIANVSRLFLLVALSTSGSAFGQFGTSSSPYTFRLQVEGPLVVLKASVNTCVENYQTFFALRDAAGQQIGGLIPVGIPPMDSGTVFTAPIINAVGDTRLKPGVYQLSVDNNSVYGNANRNIDASKYCRSFTGPVAHVETILFNVGQGSVILPRSFENSTPIVLQADALKAKEGKLEFGAFLPNQTRLTFSQESLDGKTKQFSVHVTSTGGSFEKLSFGIPRIFDPSLPIDVHAQDEIFLIGTDTTVLPKSGFDIDRATRW